MLIDIVILPPQKIRSKIGNLLRKEIGKVPNYFVVDNKRLIPHLSLWHLKTVEKNIDKIMKELQQIVKKQKPLKISSSKFIDTKKYKCCVEFTVKENKSLNSFQKKVFESIYKYKTGTMPPFASFLKIKTSKKQLEIEKYGRGLGFHPHFTMGWLKNEKDTARVIKKIRKTSFDFLAKEVYICEVDRWWQVKRIIKKIDFGLK